MRQGIEQGEKNAKIKIAKSLLEILDDKTIAEKTGLSSEYIQEIRIK